MNTWDPALYSGSAAYRPRGRVAYPQTLADRLAVALDLDGTGRLLDIGCGPSSLTLLLADSFAETVGLDADEGMIEQAHRQAATAGTTNT